MAQMRLPRRTLLLAAVAACNQSALAQVLPNATSPNVVGQMPVVTVASISALRSLTTRPSLVAVISRAVAGDGGGGLFRWEAKSDRAVDGVMVVEPDGGLPGRYLRVFSGIIDAAWFGEDIQAAIDTAQILRANVQVSKITDLYKTLVLRSAVNLFFTSGAKLLWRGSRIATCVETDSADVTTNAIWNGLTIDTGPEFEGAALSIHSAHNVHADRITLITAGRRCIALRLVADSTGGGTPTTKRNVTACTFGAVVQQGQCGTFFETGGQNVGADGSPQVVTLNTIGSMFAANCAQYGLHLRSWTDNNAFPGVNRLSLNGDGAIGLQVGGASGTDNRGVYMNKFGILAVDTFGSMTDRIGVNMDRSKLTIIDAYYQSPPAEGGRLVATRDTISYDIRYYDDSTGKMIHYAR